MTISTPCLTKNIVDAMNNAPGLGIILVYKHNQTKNWSYSVFDDSFYSKQALTNIIFNNKYNDFHKNFAILDKYGNVCYSNCKYQSKVDDFGIIHINNELIVAPIDDKKSILLTCKRYSAFNK